MTISASFRVDSLVDGTATASLVSSNGEIFEATLSFKTNVDIAPGAVVHLSGHIQKATENGLPEGLEKVSRQSLTAEDEAPADDSASATPVDPQN